MSSNQNKGDPSLLTPYSPAKASGTSSGRPRIIDFNRVDTSSTYSALSSCVKLLLEAGRRHTDFVSRSELDIMIYEFETRKVDLSNVLGFPYDAPDLDNVLILLARLQNRMAMQGTRDTKCTLRDIMEDALLDREKKNHRYDIGEWVEVRGPSMKYRLERIVDIIRSNDDDGDGDPFVYETAVDHKLKEESIRWPREALRRVFGMGPWAWRQWASVKLEKKLRFQEGHPDDIEILDIRAYAIELWELWLADNRNIEFRDLFERVGESGQNELIHHIMAPFNLLHNIATNADDNWELEEAGTSIFTYVSLLGSGFFDAFIVFLLQVSIPVILFIFYTDPNREQDEIAVGTRPLLLAVLVYYTYKVYQDLWVNFNDVAGLSSTVNSRIQSLRRITWDDGNDSWYQSIGHTIDLFMNTGYLCFLNLFNIYILFNISDPFEILGSVIFFQFLFDLDEEVGSTEWWDSGKRFLKSGIMSIVLQNTMRRDYLRTTETYLDKMGATLTKEERKEVEQIFLDAGLPSDYDFLHGNEVNEGDYLLTIQERVDRLRRMESKAALQDEYDDESMKPAIRFRSGIFSTEYHLFERSSNLRCWSQWEVVLFAFPVPNLVPDDYTPGTKLTIPSNIADTGAIRKKVVPGKTKRQRFMIQVMEVLKCADVRVSLYKAGNSAWWFTLTRVLHQAVAWICYCIQFLFFAGTVLSAVAVYYDDWYCTLHQGSCEFSDYFGDGDGDL